MCTDRTNLETYKYQTYPHYHCGLMPEYKQVVLQQDELRCVWFLHVISIWCCIIVYRPHLPQRDILRVQLKLKVWRYQKTHERLTRPSTKYFLVCGLTENPYIRYYTVCCINVENITRRNDTDLDDKSCASGIRSVRTINH